MQNAITILSKSSNIIAISNYSSSSEIEKISSNYECVVRFNAGSNPVVLNNYSWYNNKTDVCVLSGWNGGNFGPLYGFSGKPILFSRPIYSVDSDEDQADYVRPFFINQIKNYSNSLSYLPSNVFNEIKNKYEYRASPTTGITILYYIRNYLNKNIECINFLRNMNNLNNFFTKKNCGYNNHHPVKELQILKELNIKNWTI